MPEKKQRRFKANEVLFRASAATAIVSGAVCFLVCALLIVNFWQISRIDPLDHPELARLRAQLTGVPEADAPVYEAIRALDLLARASFFTSQEMLRGGGLIALVSAIAFLLALRIASACRPQLPAPAADGPQQYFWTDRARARELLTFLGGLWLLAALLAAAFTRLDIPAPTPDEIAAAFESPTADLVIPDWEEVQRQWPSFRGPGGYGVAHFITAPTNWDVASGTNILWKTDVPLPGRNSPVVWNNRVYVSGADEQRREVFCFDADTGELLWRTPVGTRPVADAGTPDVADYTGWAASSLAVQNDSVCAVFASGHLACLDDSGVVRWEKHLGAPDNHYGHSSSLVIFEHRLIVQYDQRTNGAMYAFDLSDGADVWKAERTRISWASPIIVNAQSTPMLAVVSTRDLDVYDPRSGALRWTMDCLGGEVGPSPAYGAGMFFVANEYADASAVRPPAANSDDGEPELLWQFYESLPDISSPLATDKRFYLLTSRGEIVCLRPEDGEALWTHEHEEAFYASPVLVGDRIYALDKAGLMIIFKDADRYDEIASLSLGEAAVATPAFMDGRIYARTESALIGIGER